ncbi:MAG TPA: hypothetical protein H9727_03680 [Candidatus Borkfalkia avistercoris]|uniref:CMP/dCMP-type deaminase domain-containing protein n=1 Tax=Candidatus Borkfalkia avistercoris TaxID=2838504 RepID=A0A9D2CYT8_9FIRM|nr:hypothetical protein [Candidatus Borkfalkia avistercoris]
MTYKEMYELAVRNLLPKEHGSGFSSGFVSAVLEGANGKYYCGVNIDLYCGLGFCAERSAAAAMITDGETVIRRVVCVGQNGALMTPCGSCREFISLLSPENRNTEFLCSLEGEKTIKLSELLPFPWDATE